MEIGLPVPEKRIFTIYGHGGHLGHVTSIVSSDFHFLVPESFHTNLFQIGAVVVVVDVCFYYLSGHWLQ